MLVDFKGEGHGPAVTFVTVPRGLKVDSIEEEEKEKLEFGIMLQCYNLMKYPDILKKKLRKITKTRVRKVDIIAEIRTRDHPTDHSVTMSTKIFL
jgi:hypothetical protein